MKKLLVATFLLFASTVSIFAIDMSSEKIFEHPLNEESKEFKEIESSLSDSAMKADFVQTKLIAKFKKSLKSSGTMMLQPGKGMMWITEKPYESKMVVTKDCMKQQVAGGKVVSQNVEGNAIYIAIAEAMENVFSGRFSQVKEVFDAYFIIDKDEWYIGLVPLSKEFSSVVSFITLNGKDYIEKVYMEEVGGNSILYEFDNVELRELYEEEKDLFNF